MAPDALQPEPIDLKLLVPWNQRQLAHGPTTTHKHTVAANGSPTLSEFRWVVARCGASSREHSTCCTVLATCTYFYTRISICEIFTQIMLFFRDA